MTKPTTTRQHRTPRERAEQVHGVAARLVNRLTDKKAGLVAELAEVEHELMLAERRRDYLAASPDLEDVDPGQMTIDDAAEPSDDATGGA